MVTLVAFPPKVFPLTTTGVSPHVLPLVLLKVKVGPFTQGQSILNVLPVVVHPDEFLTVMVWFPLSTPVKIVLV
jgi:hypothetical protein